VAVNRVSEILFPNSMTTAQAIESIKSIDFETFNFMKQKWMRNLAFTWLIEGHLTAENALKMV
jgi:hypothetical protein